MSADRIPCPHCGSMILDVTAKHNAGLCAPCKRDKDHENRQTEKKKFRRNPPKTQDEIDRIAPDTLENLGRRNFLQGLLPARLDPADFSEKSFLRAIRKIVDQHNPDGKKICEEFLGLCDPILHETESLSVGLEKLPRPYRESMAVFQLWGMMTSNGISSYLESTDRKVDAEVKRGLRLFELMESLRIIERIERARRAFDPMEGMADDLKDEVEDVLYRELDEFEANVLGPFLIGSLTKS